MSWTVITFFGRITTSSSLAQKGFHPWELSSLSSTGFQTTSSNLNRPSEPLKVANYPVGRRFPSLFLFTVNSNFTSVCGLWELELILLSSMLASAFLFTHAQSTLKFSEFFFFFSIPPLNWDDWQGSLCELGRERIQHPLYRQGDEMQGSRKRRSLPTRMSSWKEEPRSNPAHLEKPSIHFTAWSQLQPALSAQGVLLNTLSPSTRHRKHLFRQMFKEVFGWSPLPSCKTPSAQDTFFWGGGWNNHLYWGIIHRQDKQPHFAKF